MTVGWLSAAVEKIWDFFVGMTVFRGMSLVITPPTVSIPMVKGLTSRRTRSPVSCSPERTPGIKEKVFIFFNFFVVGC